jgi:hypothetical protein
MREDPLHHIHHGGRNVRHLHCWAIGNRGAKIPVIQKAFLVGIFGPLTNSLYGQSENENFALSSAHVL